MITLENLNALSKADAFTKFEQCCVSKTWVEAMVDNRPFFNENDLIKKAAAVWFNKCSSDDFKEACTGHPKIGDVESLKAKFAHTKEWASGEQSKMSDATSDIINALSKANSSYEEKFGYIFIVSASGKSADEMLAIINKRLQHEAEDELFVAMNEQHKITVIRLSKLVAGLVNNADLRSHITTHALDTSVGVPASNMMITLKGLKADEADEWKPISVGITNSDGRIGEVLPAGRKLNSGIYMLVFDTKAYYNNHNQKGFYPEVTIQFEVTDQGHYHIPLLINPFGYSTYRGS